MVEKVHNKYNGCIYMIRKIHNKDNGCNYIQEFYDLVDILIRQNDLSE